MVQINVFNQQMTLCHIGQNVLFKPLIGVLTFTDKIVKVKSYVLICRNKNYKKN